MKNFFKSNLLKSSSWILLGSIFSKGAMLLFGVLIARLYGDEIFGEYGLIKSTILTAVLFSSIGLNITINKSVSELNFTREILKIKLLAIQAIFITIIINLIFCAIIFIYSDKIVNVLFSSDHLSFFLKISAFTIFLFSVANVLEGILFGLKKFKIISKINIISGIITLTISSVITFYFNITGAIVSLILIQLYRVFHYHLALKKLSILRTIKINDIRKAYPLLKATFPISLQESIFAFSYLLINIIIVNNFSLGDLGFYTAALQWNSIILFVPVMLKNVFLSYLSSEKSDNFLIELKKMTLLTVIASIIPISIIFIFSDFIENIYGVSFIGLSSVLKISIFLTLFSAISNVLSQSLISLGLNWTLLIFKFVREILIIIFFYILIFLYGGFENIFYAGMLSYLVFIILVLICLKRKLI